ncbi:hypothetical protein RGV33_05150 [Pseudomonas sp. Bout1]|uniref:hypothetical protein n=1 Tax=Pseudomonas sp. Bout1 TaxID=3048600 RepID=UPI002AB34617|nr:hypothetical protein [Pseudomonas sp. Bout1]MDY7531066.1 hypothetical protein [Pseudomonas sp. Bout1]MEB0183720.1 hypothetical protein [Pseudomonas sp. Bout1]
MIVGNVFHNQSLIQPYQAVQPVQPVQPVEPVQPSSPSKEEPSGKKQGGALSGLGGSLL